MGIALPVDEVADDDMVGRYVDGDDQRGLFVEFVVLDGIFHERLQGNGRDEEIFCGQVGDLDDHADRVGESYFEQIEIIAEEFDLFPEQDEVSFPIAQDITIDAGESVVVTPGTEGVAGDEVRQGVKGIKDEVGVDLVLECLEFGLGLGDIELFDPGFVLFFFPVEEEDLVYINNETGGDDDQEDAIDHLSAVVVGFGRPHFPCLEPEERQEAGVDDIGKEQSDDDPGIGFPVPRVFFPD